MYHIRPFLNHTKRVPLLTCQSEQVSANRTAEVHVLRGLIASPKELFDWQTYNGIGSAGFKSLTRFLLNGLCGEGFSDRC